LLNLHWFGKYNFQAANGVCWSYKVDWISSLLSSLSTNGLSITLLMACDLLPVLHNNTINSKRQKTGLRITNNSYHNLRRSTDNVNKMLQIFCSNTVQSSQAKYMYRCKFCRTVHSNYTVSQKSQPVVVVEINQSKIGQFQ